MTFGVTYKVKKNFFDRKAVEALIGRDKAKVMGKAGAFIRKRARSSLRRRKKPSAPGSPPSVHSTDKVATLKNILFAYDPHRASVVIGPVRLNLHSMTRQGSGPGAQNVLSRGAVPGTLEFGGMIGVRKMPNAKGEWVQVPFGHRRRPSRLIPVWKATPAEKAAASGTQTVYRGNRALNFYEVPEPASRIFWTNIAARPFMGPAGDAEMRNFPSLWSGSTLGRAG